MFRATFLRRCAATATPLTARSNAIRDEINSFCSTILRPNDPFGHAPHATFNAPLVLLLGNHSSGKSTFINRLLGTAVQQAGVAPTDDGFTVIQRGDYDLDEDGPSSVTNPKLQFEELKHFNQQFVNHFRVKTRKLPPTSRFPVGMMVIDSPGMIDTPVSGQGGHSRTSVAGQGRGYDFLKVTEWLARRADVILIVFDPANPGTTGETLDVLTESLAGMEHKFLILMNKVDMFTKVTDFARAYGALCWNLSKVIPMKDIPRIYTTYTPVEDADSGEVGLSSRSSRSGKSPASSSSSSSSSSDSDSDSRTAATTATTQQQHATTAVPRDELDRARREVLAEVLRAPLRRLDNLITEMEEAAHRIALSARVTTELRRRYRLRLLTLLTATGGITFVTPAAGVMVTAALGLSGTAYVVSAVAGLAAAALSKLVVDQNLSQYETFLIHNAMDEIVAELYPGRKKTSEVEARWLRVVRPLLMEELSAAGGIRKALTKSFSSATIADIERVANDEVARLRLEVAAHKEEVMRQSQQLDL